MGQKASGKCGEPGAETCGDAWRGQLPPIPATVLEKVFFNIPGQDVVCVCRLVCQQWKEIVDSASYWKERCRWEGYKPYDDNKTAKGWCQFYILSKKRQNLLRNPGAVEHFSGWKAVIGDEEGPHIEPLPSDQCLPDERVQKFFVTPHVSGVTFQLIDLVKEGYGQYLMDKVQPDILVSDWFSLNWGCQFVHRICVELLNRRKKVIQKSAPVYGFYMNSDEMRFFQETYVFRDYGPGVRFIRFTRGGDFYWASSVEIIPPGEAVTICNAQFSCT